MFEIQKVVSFLDCPVPFLILNQKGGGSRETTKLTKLSKKSIPRGDVPARVLNPWPDRSHHIPWETLEAVLGESIGRRVSRLGISWRVHRRSIEMF